MPTISGSATATTAGSGLFGLGYAVPEGWGATWRAARNNAASARTEVLVFGDSTTWGAGQNYSWVQRLRDRSSAAGYAHGGKGVFGTGDSNINYDAPEVTGKVSGGFGAAQSSGFYDVLAGEGFHTTTVNDTVTVRGVVSGPNGVCRIFWIGSSGGSLGVTVDGGTETVVSTVGNNETVGMHMVTGLAAGTRSIVLRNIAGTQTLAVAFMNASGIVYQKYARSGQAMPDYFGPFGTVVGNLPRGFRDRYVQPVFGLTSGNHGTNLSWQQPISNVSGAPRPSLAILDLGFNDLSVWPTAWSSTIAYTANAEVMYGGIRYRALQGSTNSPPAANPSNWAVTENHQSLEGYVEGIHLFCRLAQAAGADPLVISGVFAINQNSYTVGGQLAAATRSTALACGAAWVDFMFPTLGKPNAYVGSLVTNDPHLGKTGYQQQADFLWDKVLSK